MVVLSPCIAGILKWNRMYCLFLIVLSRIFAYMVCCRHVGEILIWNVEVQIEQIFMKSIQDHGRMALASQLIFYLSSTVLAHRALVKFIYLRFSAQISKIQAHPLQKLSHYGRPQLSCSQIFSFSDLHL